MIGVLIVTLVSGDLLSTLAGSAVLTGVLLSVLVGHVPVNRETATIAASASISTASHSCSSTVTASAR